MVDDTSKGVPQFATAELPAPSPGIPCVACRQVIKEPYFQVNGKNACARCVESLQSQAPKDSHADFMRAVAFGIAGAVAGLVLYVTFALATGFVIGFASLAVGWIVGKAMIVGSRGAGGRRYQITAVLLTYLAVSLSAVPIAISQFKHRHEQQQTQAAPNSSDSGQKKMDLGRAIGVLVLLGVASPFLDLQNPSHGLIGLIILFVGMRFAWKFTAGRPFEVTGPLNPPAPSAASI